jgi:hypothetical protein
MHLLTIVAKRAIRPEMPVERLAGDAQFLTELTYNRFRLSHRCHGQAKFGRRYLLLATTISTPRALTLGQPWCALKPVPVQIPSEQQKCRTPVSLMALLYRSKPLVQSVP